MENKKTLNKNEYLDKYGYLRYKDMTSEEKKEKMLLFVGGLSTVKEYGSLRKMCVVNFGPLNIKFEEGVSDKKVIRLKTTDLDYLSLITNQDGKFGVRGRIFECKSKENSVYYRYELILAEEGFYTIARYGSFDKAQNMIIRRLISLNKLNPTKVNDFVMDEDIEELVD